MSSIPASAMPHAKAHEPVPTPKVAPTPKAAGAKPFPWLALTIGGVLVAGTAITAAIVARRPKPPAKRGSARKAATARKPRRKKAQTA